MAEASTSGGEHNLTYNITGWSIYELDPSTGDPYSAANQTGEFNKTSSASYIKTEDGRIYTTNDSSSSNTIMYN